MLNDIGLTYWRYFFMLVLAIVFIGLFGNDNHGDDDHMRYA